MKYLLQTRYQDESWTNYYVTDDLGKAKKDAKKMSKDAICYGMVRIIDTLTNHLIIEYWAGEGANS